MFKFAIKADGDKFGVYRLNNTTNQPFGKAIKTFSSTADAEIILPELDRRLAVGGKDYWDDDDYWCDYNYGPYLNNDDARVMYDALGGNKTKACANCAFFQAAGAKCYLKSGDTVATGLCNLWLTAERPVTFADPIPVVIVNPAPVAESGSASLLEEIAGKIKALAATLTGAANKGELPLVAPKTDPTLLGGFKVYEGGVWAAWWSNSFKDKHGEIFSDKSHDDFIYRVESGVVPYPELWYRHMPVAGGKALWLGRVGHMMLAAGKFYDTQAGEKFYEHYQKTSDSPRTVSHGYIYLADDKSGGVYSGYNTYEISPLYAGEEANPYTEFGIKELKSMITDSKKQDLIGIIGAELTEKYLQFGEERSKELEALGVSFKAADSAPIVDDSARQAAAALATKQAELETALNEQGKKLDETLTAIKQNLETLVTGEQTRNEAVSAIQKQINDAFGMQPRASQNRNTVISPDDPYVKFMKTKEDEQQPAEGSGIGGLFGQILDNTSSK